MGPACPHQLNIFKRISSDNVRIAASLRSRVGRVRSVACSASIAAAGSIASAADMSKASRALELSARYNRFLAKISAVASK
jgi:hypothetical protein